MSASANAMKDFFDRLAPRRRFWKRRARAYHRDLERWFQFNIPPGARVLEIGCGTGELLAATRPARGVGVDISPRMLELAAAAFPQLVFIEGDAHNLPLDEKFDYVILSDVVGHLDDVCACFAQVRKVSTPRTRVIVTHYNKLWYPAVAAAESLGLKMPEQTQNWLTIGDLRNLLDLAGFEVVRSGLRFLFPFDAPLLAPFVNRFIAHLPWIERLCLIQHVVAKPIQRLDATMAAPAAPRKDYSVSVIVPTLNEVGNIDGAVARVPPMGRHVETIFIDGHSTDGTVEKIHAAIARQPERDLKFAFQDGKGKADAVFKGLDMATGDILMILDSDLTSPPEDLPKFYEALACGAGEFVNGCRLVYPMEHEAMRTLNYYANHAFSLAFTWLLGQRIKDTLCGTKAFFREDYARIRRQRDYFGDFDPFGDFSLLFGATKLNLKIVDLPIRYRNRDYGEIKIDRFRHGWLLLKMCVYAARRMKFI